ncbi:MAG: TetR/AcrR family transcriptional regulator [Myxococcota bacterium]
MKRLPTEERRRQIADAALHIIAEQGLRKFTVSAISDEVGLADGTIFRHFEDKDDIVLEAVNRLGELMLEQELPTGGGPIERLKAFLTARVELMSKRPELFKVLFSDDLIKAGPEEAAIRVRGLKQMSMSYILQLLQEAHDSGELRDDASPEELLFIVHGTALAMIFSKGDLGAVAADTTPEDVWETVAALITGPGDRT